MRLDLWLDIACLFKTRSEAQKACKNGKIDVNGQPAKPHRELKVGDEIVRPLGRSAGGSAWSSGHWSRSTCRRPKPANFTTDLTPPPTPEEIEARKIARLTGPFLRPRSAGAPDKRERRELRRLKERN